MINIVMPIHNAVLNSRFDAHRIEVARRVWPHYDITTTGLIVSKETCVQQHLRFNIVDTPRENIHVLRYHSLSVQDSDWNGALSLMLRLMSSVLKKGRYLQIDDDEFLVIENFTRLNVAFEGQERLIGIVRKFITEEGDYLNDGIRLITRDIQDCHREYTMKYPERLQLLDAETAYIAHIRTLREDSFKIRGGSTCRHKRRQITPGNNV